MAKLKNSIAVEINYLNSLKENGGKVLSKAEEVTEAIEKYTRQVERTIESLPTGVKRTGTNVAITEARKCSNASLYRDAKTSMNKILKKMEEEVPRYDKTCKETATNLTAVTKSLTNRIISLENLIAHGGITLEGDTFLEQLEQCKKDWEKETEALKEILEEIRNALKGVKNEACCYSADPVNLSTGNFVYDREDLKIGGAVPLAFHRYYNSLDERQGVLGEKWTHNYEIYLAFEKDHIIVVEEDGRENSFTKEGEGYTGVTGSIYLLKETDQEYQYKEKDGAISVFDKQGKLLERLDAKGNRITFTYNQEKRLERVESLSGYLLYYYDIAGKLEKVADHTGRKVILAYEEGRLSRVTTPSNVDYMYTYGIDGNLKSVVNPQEVKTVTNWFDKEGRTKKQRFPDGGVMRFSYEEEQGIVILTERNGSRTVYEHDERYRHVRTIYEDGEESYTYNRNNQVTSHTDKNGNRTIYAYDGWGNLARTADALGTVTTMLYNGRGKLIKLSVNGEEKIRNHYDSKGNLASTTDGEGNTTTFSYDENKRLVCICQADGSEIGISYDERGNIISVTRPDGGQTAYVYDDLNRITETTDENGNTTHYVYDAADRIVEVTNPEGNTKTYTYNVSGMVTEIVDFDGGRITRGYNVLNKLEWETDKEGNTTHYEYDAMWNISRRVLPNGGVMTYRYNGLNQLEQVTNLLGGTLFYEYNPNGNVTRIQNGDGEEIRYAYDVLNRRISVTDALGNETRTCYDALGRVIRETDAFGRSFDMVYDGNGNRTAEQNPVNGGMTYTYDCMGRVLSMTDGVGRVRKYTYDVCGRIRQMEDFDGKTVDYQYDRKGNMTGKKESTGTEYYYAYDRADRLIEIRDGEKVLQSYTYDEMGNRLSATDAFGRKTQYHYTPNGHMDRVTDPAGNVTVYEYDVMGQLEKIIYPSEETERVTVYERNLAGQVTGIKDTLGYTEHYEYDSYGRMTGKTDRKGQYTSFGRNAMGDITHIGYADGKEVFLSYDPLRQVKELKDWNGTTQFVTDETGRTKEITDAAGNRTAYEWGVLGERTGVTYPDGYKVTYQYDQYLNLKEVTAGEDTTIYIYDEKGRLAEKQYANGMSSQYTYTKEGKLESLVHKDKEGVIDRFCYTYDAVGNCIAEERQRQNMPEESGNYRYSYDELGRLTTVEKDGRIRNGYEYDIYGNRTAERKEDREIRYVYNAGNQLIKAESSSGAEAYLYDANGNLLQIMQAGQAKAEYGYDSMDNLIFAKTGKGTAKYGYNGFGKKVSMETRQMESSCRTDYILDYTRDYNNLLQRKTGERTEDYFWDDNLLSATWMEGGGLKDRRESGKKQTYLLDQIGSPLRVCDTEGFIEKSYGYDAFGEDLYASKDVLPEHAADSPQPFGFTGYERDAVSGLYYAQARRYDARTGRFTSRDMVKGYTNRMQSQNEYAYCLGNPLTYLDRNGREPQLVSGDDYEQVGYDEDGTPILHKKEERTKEEKLKDVEMLDQTYDTLNDGLSIMNEAGNVVMPKWIEGQTRPNNIGKGTWNKKIAGELAEQSKFYSKASKVLEMLGYVGIVVDGVVSVYDNIQKGTCWQKTLLDLSIDVTISIMLMVLASSIIEAAAGIGALFGTIPLPIVGTVSGAMAGTVVGTIIAVLLMKWLGDKLYEKGSNGKSAIDIVKESMWWTMNGCPTNSDCPVN